MTLKQVVSEKCAPSEQPVDNEIPASDIVGTDAAAEHKGCLHAGIKAHDDSEVEKVLAASAHLRLTVLITPRLLQAPANLSTVFLSSSGIVWRRKPSCHVWGFKRCRVRGDN